MPKEPETSNSGNFYGCELKKNRLTFILAVILAAVLSIFLFSLFKHLSYPLMWADESMTAIGAERVLKFGYPKCHDGKNIFYDLRHTDKKLGLDEKTDAYIGGANWGQYYFLAPFVKLAEYFEDIYQKTFILRFPFAFTGVLALFIISGFCLRFIHNLNQKLIFFILFFVIEFACISLILHLREVRYYSLMIFLTSLLIFFFSSHIIFCKLSYMSYFSGLVIFLPMLFITFSPAFFIFFAASGLFLTFELSITLFKKIKEKQAVKTDFHAFLKNLLPFISAFILISPLLFFFKTFFIAKELEIFYKYKLIIYFVHLYTEWNYLFRYDILFPFLLMLVIFINLLFNKKYLAAFISSVRFSFFLILFVFIYFFAIAKIPNYIYVRYFIVIQPYLTFLFLLNCLCFYSFFSSLNGIKAKIGKVIIILLMVYGTCTMYVNNRSWIKGHLEEITHQYKGVLDFIIPYIKENFENPEKLIIATNYEDTSYVYYLKCKCTIGMLKLNIEEDRNTLPDIIIARNVWHDKGDDKIYVSFFKKELYVRIRFPVIDFPVNNIPELNPWKQPIQHLFRTGEEKDKNNQMHIYIRKKLLNKKILENSTLTNKPELVIPSR